MSELTIFYPAATTVVSTQDRTESLRLTRTGGDFISGTPLNIVDPGSGWNAEGDVVVIGDIYDLKSNTQIYQNGQILMTGSLAENPDVYFISGNTIAFAFKIRNNEVVQIWKHFTD